MFMWSIVFITAGTAILFFMAGAAALVHSIVASKVNRTKAEILTKRPIFITGCIMIVISVSFWAFLIFVLLPAMDLL